MNRRDFLTHLLQFPAVAALFAWFRPAVAPYPVYIELWDSFDVPASEGATAFGSSGYTGINIASVSASGAGIDCSGWKISPDWHTSAEAHYPVDGAIDGVDCDDEEYSPPTINKGDLVIVYTFDDKGNYASRTAIAGKDGAVSIEL